ncbi:MAG: OmpA family protein [Acidaminococcales bacterium]|jgi:chemotaxis protein MotB|nr:OmpA family protein [Acidaminococcales bacterium]
MSKKHHGPPHEEHPDETWLVPYADLLTLLLALFIVLFATAKVDQGKFAAVGQALNVALGGGLGGALGGLGIGTALGGGGGGQTILSGGAGLTAGPGSAPTSVMSPAELESSQLGNAKSEIESFIQQLHGGIETVLTDQGLVIRIRDTALFPSGSAQLSPAAADFGQRVADIIGPIPQNILISGHTDNVPINTAQFPSNWELSSARAMSLMKYLLSINPAFNPARFSAIGCGEYRPIAPNDSEAGRARNRRVEILIQRMYIDGERAMDTLINPEATTAATAGVPASNR